MIQHLQREVTKMAITQAVCNSFKRDVLQEGHQIKTDTLKIALFTSAALSAGTSVYSSSNEVASSGGYAPGGGTLTGVTISLVQHLLLVEQQLLILLIYLYKYNILS